MSEINQYLVFIIVVITILLVLALYKIREQSMWITILQAETYHQGKLIQKLLDMAACDSQS